MITGWYVDVNVLRGFVRAADGTITKFDVPGAAYATSPTSINPSGVITGGTTLTRAAWLVVLCVPKAAPSPRLTWRPPSLATTRFLKVSTREAARSPGGTQTSAAPITASCGNRVIDHPRGPSAAKMEFPAVVNFATRCGVERDRPVVPT